jgi:hypothetical protein
VEEEEEEEEGGLGITYAMDEAPMQEVLDRVGGYETLFH